jgi:hypothetical protein
MGDGFASQWRVHRTRAVSLARRDTKMIEQGYNFAGKHGGRFLWFSTGRWQSAYVAAFQNRSSSRVLAPAAARRA